MEHIFFLSIIQTKLKQRKFVREIEEDGFGDLGDAGMVDEDSYASLDREVAGIFADSSNTEGNSNDPEIDAADALFAPSEDEADEDFSFGHDLTDESFIAASRAWHLAIQTSIDGIHHCSERSGMPPREENLSLILFTEHAPQKLRRVSLVNWIDASSYYGQTVRLDKAGRIVYSMPAWHPSRVFEDVELVYSDVGQSMLRASASLRQTLITHCQRVKFMVELTLLDGETAASCCVFCDGAADGGDRHQCPFCCLPAHQHCIDMVARRLASDFAVDVSSDVFPAVRTLLEGGGVLQEAAMCACKLCSSWLHQVLESE